MRGFPVVDCHLRLFYFLGSFILHSPSSALESAAPTSGMKQSTSTHAGAGTEISGRGIRAALTAACRIRRLRALGRL